MRTIRLITVLALAWTLDISGAMAASDAKAPAIDADVVAIEETTVPEDATSPHDPAGPAMTTDEAAAPHEAAAEHGEGGLPQLNLSTYPSQIFWLLLTFAVLYLTFSRKTLPQIGAVIANREGKIKGDLDAAEALRAQSEEIRVAYEKGLEKARAEAMAAIQGVEADAKQKANDRIEAFRKKSENEIAAAETRMDEVRAKSMGDMTAIAAEVASVAAEKITGVSADVQNAKAIVESIAGKAKAA